MFVGKQLTLLSEKEKKLRFFLFLEFNIRRKQFKFVTLSRGVKFKLLQILSGYEWNG